MTKAVSAYSHHVPLPPCTCESHPPGVAFYVSVIDGTRRGLVAGPYRHHADAIAAVPEVREWSEEVNAAAAFMAFGTCSIQHRDLPDERYVAPYQRAQTLERLGQVLHRQCPFCAFVAKDKRGLGGHIAKIHDPEGGPEPVAEHLWRAARGVSWATDVTPKGTTDVLPTEPTG